MGRREQRRFVPRELRLSIAIITITSLMAGILMIYLAGQISSMIGREITFFMILAAYIFLVAFFTLYFAHRFIGPFERLKLELRLFRAGQFSRRLRIRKTDDAYIKSFIEEINLLLQEFEKESKEKRTS